MKISIIPDAHCGYAYGERRGNDSLLALEEAIEKSLDADMILIAGDLFDSRLPKQEVFARVAKILSKAQNIPCRTTFIETRGKSTKDISPSALRGIPIIAIHGNHDRRSKHMVNPIQTLEHAGLLIHLHCGSIVFDASGEKIAIHGMSSVPERYAKDILNKWKPLPIANASNILLMHQSIEPYIYSPLEPPSIKLDDLPAGFNLIANGHIHWHDQKTMGGFQLLITGSLSPTSIHKKESEQKKGFFTYDGQTISFKGIENQRKIFWENLYLNENIKYDLNNKISNLLSKFSGNLEPIIKIKINGMLEKGQQMPSFSDIENRYKEKAILNITKKVKSEDFKEQVELLRLMRESKLSPEEQGLALLRENLRQSKCAINPDEIFDLLIENKTDTVFEMMMGNDKPRDEIKQFNKDD
jgi:DNA repair exonuclease SbcCD nuclease subunit